MDKDKLCIINEILKEFILDNDKNKTWIYQINQSDEWLDATYEAFLEMESEFHNLLKIQRSKIIESIENGTVTNEILKIYIENIEKQQVLYEQIVYKNFLNIMNLVKQEILSERPSFLPNLQVRSSCQTQRGPHLPSSELPLTRSWVAALNLFSGIVYSWQYISQT